MTSGQEQRENARSEVNSSRSLGCIVSIVITVVVAILIAGFIFGGLQPSSSQSAADEVAEFAPTTNSITPSPMPDTELPPEGQWLVTYTDGNQICPGVVALPVFLKDPHNVNISHSDDGESIFVEMPEGTVHLFSGILPELPVDIVFAIAQDSETEDQPNYSSEATQAVQGAIISSDSSVNSENDLNPHPSIFTGSVEVALTVTFMLEYNQYNMNPEGILVRGEGDGRIYGKIINSMEVQGTSCQATVYYKMENAGQ